MMVSVSLAVLFASTISTAAAFSFRLLPFAAKQRNAIGITHNAPRIRSHEVSNLLILGGDAERSCNRFRRERSCVYAKDDDTCDGDEGNDVAQSPPTSFVIREAQEQDIGAAANILADAFSTKGGKKPNFFAQRIERMDTYLTLKSRFETFRYAERSGALQCMLVACSTQDDNKIVAFCEVDNRPPGGEINPAPRPYISNLAVQDSFRRMGVATALVGESEDIVRSWGEPRLHLRVDNANGAAQAMYQDRCGYSEIESRRVSTANGETMLLLGKSV
jgi:ribosomal protein S18 acetylase RimI-like enzyme